MPQCATVPFIHEDLLDGLNSMLEKSFVPEQITTDLWGIRHAQDAYYWKGPIHAPTIITKTFVIPQGRILNGMSKPESGRGQAPYAVEFFNQLFTDLDLSLLICDSAITRRILNIWQALAEQPGGVQIINFEKPYAQPLMAHSASELEPFWTPDPQMKHIRFAVAKPGATLWNTVCGGGRS